MQEQETTSNSKTTEESNQPTFDSLYANNSLFESSLWDLKIIFGQLEQHTGKPQVDWRTAITIPWLQAKLLCYYLRLNILSHESDNGAIKLPSALMPPKPNAPSGELENDPTALEFYRLASKAYSESFD